MRTITGINLWIVRVSGTIQLLLGILFWTGHAYQYLPVHIVNGLLIVLTLWTAAVLALVARTRRGLAVFGLLWGVALPAFGIEQAALLVGSMHWIVRVTHLAMGLTAMGVAGTLGQAVLATLPARARQSNRAVGAVAPGRAP
jgi:hypothetical protein